jgi:group I intron endonuclease
MYSIYIITNTINDKKYVGQTCQGIARRWNQHRYDAKHSETKIARAMRAHGVENFAIELLAEAEDQDSANRLEPFWIRLFDSVANGYNIENGGKATGKITDEQRSALSKRTKEWFASNPYPESTRAAVSRAQKGRVHSEEEKANRRESCKSRVYTTEQRARLAQLGAANSKARAKVSFEMAQKIRAEFALGHKEQKQLAIEYNVSRALVCQIINNIRWTK